MILIRDIDRMRAFVKAQRALGRSIGLVPTMGALHSGHASLLKRARTKSDIVVLSVFLNPIQFSDKRDYKTYPKTMKNDLVLAGHCGVDAVFCPSGSRMYSKDFSTFVTEEDLSRDLCGKSRPGHFRGVTTVVAKLFNIIQPDVAFFGLKDAQQLSIIKRMVRDLDWPVRIEPVKTVRDAGGLAVSSRNALLSRKEREDAASMSEAMFIAKVMIHGGERSASRVIQKMRRVIRSRPTATIDYVKIVDPESLQPVDKIAGRVLVAIAAWFGKVRLIDNIMIEL